MALFPAYAIDSKDIGENNEVSRVTMSLDLETRLLASDSEHEDPAQPSAAAAAAAARTAADSATHEYYLDDKWDCGNLRVSTLYYPGRPQYEWSKARRALGEPRGSEGTKAARRRRRRYYEAAPAAGAGRRAAADVEADAEIAQRTDAYRRMIAADPDDENLWLTFIDFQERWRDASAALSAAREAAARLPRAPRLRAALHRARAALPPHERRALLRADLAAAGDRPLLRAELWLRLLADLGESASGAAELDAAAAAAVAATRALPCAYPHVLYVYGAQLRAAGLWERLTLLLELVASMNFPPAGFPPREDPAESAAAELRLRDAEDEAVGGGLPLSAVWVRAERLRAAAHWRPAAPDAALADPQRAPLPADVADLLLPLRDADAAGSLLLNALRLAGVPLVPCAGYAARAGDATGDARGDGAAAGAAGSLAALLRAARRLPPAHAARPAPRAARALLAAAADPPHRFADGPSPFRAWETALWDACLEWSEGPRREALLCWRLRWSHALLLPLDARASVASPSAAGGGGAARPAPFGPQEERDRAEARRLRAEARAALKRFAGGSPSAFAQFARVELVASGPEAATDVAWHALRAALRDPACPPHRRLYVARVASEVSGEEGGAARGWAGAWARVCAALGRAPPAAVPAEPPPAQLLEDALRTCEERCEELERGFERERDGGRERDGACEWDGARLAAALLPGEGEWAAARAALASPSRRRRLLLELCARAPAYPEGTAARYYEQGACALALWAARERRLAASARALAPLFPHNALLALACSGAPLWAWERSASVAERARAAAPPRTHLAALAAALPALLRAAAPPPGAAAAAAAAAERACERAARGGCGGALLAALRLHAAPHAPRARPEAALYEALHAHPHHKWLYVRGAAWCGGEAAALADALLERQLRLHALPDELAPAPDPRPARDSAAM